LLPLALAAIVLLSWLNARSWTYRMDGDAAVVQRSLLGHHRFGIPLTQITTLELRQSPIDRLLGVGTVALTARDTHGNERYLVMEDVPNPRQTYQDLTRLLGRAARARGNVPMG
jgi:membrane protein YdbS with pleckstrin-like domain